MNNKKTGAMPVFFVNPINYLHTCSHRQHTNDEEDEIN